MKILNDDGSEWIPSELTGGLIDIVSWYDSYSRCWIVTFVDTEGNQLWDAQYYSNRSSLNVDWGRYTKGYRETL